MTNTAHTTLIVQLFGRTETTQHATEADARERLVNIQMNNQLGRTADGALYSRRPHDNEAVVGGYRIA